MLTIIKKGFFWILFFLFSINLQAAEWQWSVEVKGMISKETNAHPLAFLWIPPNCKLLKGVVFGQHNMLEEGIFEHQSFRDNLAKLGLAEIWVTPAIDMVYNFKSAALFENTIKDLAEKSGYSELQFAPVIPIGHSAAASYPWNFAAFNPKRTLAILSIHGDAPLTNMTGSGQPNPDWGKEKIDGIPALFVMGEYEWLEGRLTPALAYKNLHPKAPVATFCDAGHGHFDFSDALIEYLNLFIRKSVEYRLPKNYQENKPMELIDVIPEKGWLIDRWRKDQEPKSPAASYFNFQGPREDAGWIFDKEMAKATENYYARQRGKKVRNIAYIQDGKLLPTAGFAGFRPIFNPSNDGLTFHLSALNIDSASNSIGKSYSVDDKITITRICGPVTKINDTTFKVAFYRMGFNNPKRSNDIWFMASQHENRKYKSGVQQANMKIPIANTTGKAQKITFNLPVEIKKDVGFIKLDATSDADVPVEYYVKEGPAEIFNGRLTLCKIPPRTKFPVKITVVAWQYGYNNKERMIKSAAPVERSFMIVN